MQPQMLQQHHETQGIVEEAFDTPGVDLTYWPDVERFIQESVDWMWMKSCDFCTGEERSILLIDALLLGRKVFDDSPTLDGEE